jgi:hypothetical protein
MLIIDQALLWRALCQQTIIRGPTPTDPVAEPSLCPREAVVESRARMHETRSRTARAKP